MDNPDDITKKELFERYIEIKTKLDLLYTQNNDMKIWFTHFVYVVIALEIINVLVHVFYKAS